MTQAEKEQDSGKEKEKERDKEKEKEQQRGVKRPIAPPVIPDPLQEVSCFPVRGFSGPETDSEQASVHRCWTPAVRDRESLQPVSRAA